MAFFSALFANRNDSASVYRRRVEARRAGVRASVTALRAAELLRAPTALMQLNESEALTVVGYMAMRRCAEGEAVIRQGDSGGTGDDGFMALVIDGEITVETEDMGRIGPHTVNVLGPGHLMGEMSLMDGAARSATCIASTDVRCAVLTREALTTLITEEPATAAKLLSAVALRLSHRLREVDGKLRLYSQLVQSMQQEIHRLVPDMD
ncbi:cyclic nucleotide-binding domain-containing protein [Hydrogenophaga palleronii]|jgi:CRP/FNR family cyclic AMP-dependent transcriptional regulator|uniref:cyclic nucleotide-binding domain-containing protein n=1 Tax=Hydrogenophaga palleronii TaxID=65655 RepID=UPI0009FDAFD4|nr:cyclic nucleotide-binding domain-containing protein [Hydrogenophaga palleronii]